MKKITLESKFSGSLVGSALGDAIGELAFHLSRQMSPEEALLQKIKRQTNLVYTDDTAMAIGIAESITMMGKLDEQHLGHTFHTNLRREPWRGYGPGPFDVFDRATIQDILYRDAAKQLYHGQGSCGNGSAMRIAPIGIFFHDLDDLELYGKAKTSSIVTHNNTIGIDGAAVLAYAVASACKLDPTEEFDPIGFAKKLVDFAATSEMKTKMYLVRTFLEQGMEPDEAAHLLKLSVLVQESVPFAIYSFLRNPKSYRECIYCAILNRGDRDTMGAMAGGISGAYLGLEAIPEEWREHLENRNHIEELAQKLFELWKTSPKAKQQENAEKSGQEKSGQEKSEQQEKSGQEKSGQEKSGQEKSGQEKSENVEP